ncbi:cellulase family glycosylhydrolase [Nocardia sp. NPDC051756]|uniref:cellulase family glycosylhydrolase n=1 Tax=Nocardia sp. NPDC051756 TaxID=3154751 RepID=UPI0034306F94
MAGKYTPWGFLALGAILVTVMGMNPMSGLAYARETDLGYEQIATPLQSAGNWLVDSTGRVVVLHGENVANKRAPHLPSALGFGGEDAELLAREGFNAVRLALFWSAAEPAPGQYDDAYLGEVARTVALLHSRGISTELEFHQDIWSEKYGGDGAPDWASIDDGLPNGAHDLIGAYLSNAAFWRATDNFYVNRPAADGVGIRDRFMDMWRHVAGYFAGTPGVIGYGPLNQPPVGAAFLPCLSDHCPPDTIEHVRSFSRDVAAAIRESDPVTPIWAAPPVTANYGTHPDLGPAPGPNMVYGFNSYCVVAALQGGGGTGCAPQWEASAAQATQYSAEARIPAVVTEFGATGAADALVENAGVFDAHQVGWFHWTYLGGDPATVAKDADSQAIVVDARQPRVAGNVREGNLDALARPYPQLTAGTPGPWHFDTGTREFTYRWNIARAAGDGVFADGSETVIAIPQRQYRDGYHLRIDGGRRVSEPGAPQLRIASCPGAGQVSVAVLPGSGPDQQSC